MAGQLPQLLGEMGDHGEEQGDHGFQSFAQHCPVDARVFAERCGGRVDQLHHARDGGVEMEIGLDALRDPADGLVGLAVQLAGEVVQGGGHHRSVHAEAVLMLVYHPVDPVEEARGPLHALGVPFQVTLRRGGEQGEQPHRVGAVLLDQVVRVDHVAFRFRHLGAVLDDHALGEQVGERLVHLQVAEVAQHLGEEARVEQVEDGVLDPADVLVDRQPVAGRFPVDGGGGQVRAGVAGEIPGGLDKGVQRVGLAPGRPAALRAGGGDEVGLLVQRAVAALGLTGAGQENRQVTRRHGHDAAVGTVDHRNGCAPVALAGDTPVT